MKKKIKVHTIFFTYKRAILLDAAIESLIKNFKNISYPISIVYHYESSHKDSYIYLKKKYNDKVIFYKRKKDSIFSKLSLFLNPLNIFFLLRWPKIFTEYNSFKFILEKIVKYSKKNFIMLCPDDIFFYKPFLIPNNLFNLIKKDSRQCFIRPAFGKNIKSFNSASEFKILDFDNIKFVQWHNSDPKCSVDMKYNFHIDAAIYEKNALFNIISKIIYHNPITLESNGFRYSNLMHLFKKTISPIDRVCSTYQINSVQTDTKLRFNKRLQVNTKILEKMYLEGYKFLHKITKLQKNQNDIIPKNIFLKKNKDIKNLKSILK